MLVQLTQVCGEDKAMHKTKDCTNIFIFAVVIEVRHGDLLNLKLKDWRNADVLFANSTCFDDILITEISRWAGNATIFALL